MLLWLRWTTRVLSFSVLLQRSVPVRIILERLGQLLDPDRIAEWAARVIPNLILGLVVFAFFYLVYRTVSWIVSRLAERVGFERTAASFIPIGLKYVMLAAIVLERRAL